MSTNHDVRGEASQGILWNGIEFEVSLKTSEKRAEQGSATDFVARELYLTIRMTTSDWTAGNLSVSTLGWFLVSCFPSRLPFDVPVRHVTTNLHGSSSYSHVAMSSMGTIHGGVLLAVVGAATPAVIEVAAARAPTIQPNAITFARDTVALAGAVYGADGT